MLPLLLLGCGPRVDWSPCDAEGDFDCADLDVPLDPADPDGPLASIALTRHEARDPRLRLGVLVLHLGGPGVGSRSALLAHLWPSAGLADPLDRVADYFDVVAVDWRGTGEAIGAVHCLDEARWAAMDAASWAPATSDEWAALGAAAAGFRDGCLAEADPDLLATMDAVTAAHDLDVVRRALHEDELTLLTWSYGTHVAAAYARLHPEHLRTAVLDGVMADHPDRWAFLDGQARGFEEALVRWADWCAGNPTCPVGADAPDGEAVLARLDEVDATFRADPDLPPDAVLGAALACMYSPGWGWPELGARLQAARGGDTGPLVDARGWMGLPAGPDDDGLLAGYTATMSVDLPLDGDLDGLAGWAEATAAVAPHSAAAIAAFDAPGLGWTVAPRQAPVSGPSEAPPLLLIGGHHDPATPGADAAALRDTLANGSALLRYEGDGHSQSGVVACLGAAAADWLLVPGEAPSTCAARVP